MPDQFNTKIKNEIKNILIYFSPGGAPPKSRITKSNTMSNATGRAVLGQTGVDKRRSAFEATKFSTSSDKNDEDLESDFMHRLFLVFIHLKWSQVCLVLTFSDKNDKDLGSDFMHSNKSLFS